MRLYVECNECHTRVYLNIVADTRKVLSRRLGSKFFILRCPYCQHRGHYHVNDVHAEVGRSTGLPAGAIMGGVVGGAVGGPVGLIIGGLLGAVIGGNFDAAEKQKVNKFNRERI